MKLSVSIAEEDVEFLDAYTKTHGIASRSAAVQQAIRLLRASELSDSYADAFTEWADGEDEAVWDVTTADS